MDRSNERTELNRPRSSILSRVRRLNRVAGGFISRLTLVQRFAIFSFFVLIVGAFIIGRFIADEIEGDVTARNGAITALYVDSFVSPRAQGLIDGSITEAAQEELGSLLTETDFGEDILSFKIWDSEGRIVYASNSELGGQQFDIQGGLLSALAGKVDSQVSPLNEEEHANERTFRRSLIETYAPIRQADTGTVIGAMEFYQDPETLQSEVASSQRNGWIVVGVSTAGMYVVLLGLVMGASNTLTKQHRSLQLMAEDNRRLATRVRGAAAQRTETDEQLMMRIARDLHDGPAQDLGFALLRIETLRERARDVLAGGGSGSEAGSEEFDLVETALTSALKEVRDISSGMRLPELAGLSLEETIQRAVADHRSKTGSEVVVGLGADCRSGSLPTKIVVYRVIQEALSNSYRHAPGSSRHVEASCSEESLELSVSDSGPGFDPGTPVDDASRSHIGVRGMRERVEMLGGILRISSSRAGGTKVTVRIPLDKMS
jgi:signal transduction histidine kinase